MTFALYPTYYACRKANPGAVIIIKVDGGFIPFFTMYDYEIWKNQ
jgi:hypothetical protein